MLDPINKKKFIKLAKLQVTKYWHEVLSSKPLSSIVPQNRRVWKSHLDWNDIYKTEHDIKYIYVARNPMDVAVSLYHHSRAVVSME